MLYKKDEAGQSTGYYLSEVSQPWQLLYRAGQKPQSAKGVGKAILSELKKLK